MVLPRLDWTETSPSVFFSATSPDGADPFQVQEAGHRAGMSVAFGKQRSRCYLKTQHA